MKLYGPTLSQNVFRPLLVARHLELDVEVVAVNLPGGEHKGEEYRKLNPFGRIPVLVDGDYQLWESLAISQYFASQAPNALWPDDIRARATIASWQAWSIAHLGRGIGMIQFQRLFKAMFGMGEPDEAIVAQGLTMFEAEVKVLEDRFADTGSGWLVGDGLTLADFDVGGWFLHAEATQLPMPPKTAAWVARLKALPAWNAAAKG